VVKIKTKSILTVFIGIIMVIFLASVVSAATTRLYFSDVDVRVGGKNANNQNDGDRIDREAEPGENVEFRIQVESNFTSSDNIDIEDILIEVTIEGIDDGDDLDDESRDFKLRPGRNHRETIKFQVPLEVDEDDYDVLIRAEGDDENGTNHFAEMRLRLEVDKETHEIIITRNTLTPADLSCGKRNVQIGFGLLNIGNDDEEDVTVHLFNEDLEFEARENIGELEAEPFEDTSKFSKTYSFNVPPNVQAGSYPITLRALYDNDRRKAEKIATLNVNECATSTPGTPVTSTPNTNNNQQPGNNGVTVVTPPTITQGQQLTQTNVALPPDTTVTSEGFFKSNAFVIAVIIAEVIAVIIGIVLIFTLFARRD
jgi:hypothetical protein